jgi:hypothetical protein
MAKSSITDRPISRSKENFLGIENYATALSEFILESSTPLTIGMQGEWGTGKTSLMYLVKEHLDKKNIASSWVNTWEYSLFKEPNETTPAVLKGLMQNLILKCKDLNYWGTGQKVNEVLGVCAKGAKDIGSLALKAGAKKATGMDIEFSSFDSLISEIAKLKTEIQNLINLIIADEKNPVKKVVFFVDDLDRIDPPVAVEILEALKNIFDIDNCVFILAIDYDVIIKGLEKKFGKKTHLNEREFRSFFDKIIQVPFSMPTSAYNVDRLLKKKLDELGIKLREDLEDDYIQLLKLTVGYIPRGIKRYINSYSLLKKIRSLGSSESGSGLLDFCLFAVLGIQISYPTIFRLLNKKFDYLSWNKAFAILNGIDEIKPPDETNEFINEEWKQVLWCFCQSDPYLKAKALSIIEVFNLLRDTLGKNLHNLLEDSMEFAAMTSVDDDVETRHVKKSKVRDNCHYIITDPKNKVYPTTDNLSEFCKNHGLHAGNMKKVARNKSKNCKGWKCKYADDNFIAIDQDGNEYKVDDLQEFCAEHDLSPYSMRKVARDQAKQTKGWKCRYGELICPEQNLTLQ